MTTVTLASALKAHTEYRHSARQMIQRVGETLWASGAGDRFASLVYAVMEPESGGVDLAGTAGVAGLILRSDGYKQFQFGDELLGNDPEPACRAASCAYPADGNRSANRPRIPARSASGRQSRAGISRICDGRMKAGSLESLCVTSGIFVFREGS